MSAPPSHRRLHYQPPPTGVRESGPSLVGDEMELQARWFAGDFGRTFSTTDGQKVEIVSPGVWNREAGPDFIEVAVSFDQAAPVRGAVELDMEDRDWERHGHATNPDFDRVILHVFLRRGSSRFFTRSPANRALPQVHLETLPEDAFTLENPPEAMPGRCQGPLQNLPDRAVESLLRSAAKHRLENKAGRIRHLQGIHGPEETLYQLLAATLGYKENQLAFLLLAQRLPLRHLRPLPQKEAVLFGCAGFLPKRTLHDLPDDSQEYAKTLWASWWEVRHHYPRFEEHPVSWRLTGLRPANHPQRRLAALTVFLSQWKETRGLIEKGEPDRLLKELPKIRHPFWTRHHTLGSRRTPSDLAMLGRSRCLEICANLQVPWQLAANGTIPEAYWRLPASGGNRRLRIAATRLFASEEQARKFTRKLYQEQALLQIYHDYCRHDVSNCSQCGFPETVSGTAQST